MEKIIGYFWILLFVFSIINILIIIGRKHIINYIKYCTDHKLKNEMFLLITVLILVISALNPTYYLGGDDTRLYFMYPELFLNNFVLNIGTSSGLSILGSYLPPLAISSFTLLMMVLKKLVPFFNLQSLLYSANIFLALLFFYKLINIASEVKKDKLTTALPNNL